MKKAVAVQRPREMARRPQPSEWPIMDSRLDEIQVARPEKNMCDYLWAAGVQLNRVIHLNTESDGPK